MVTGVGDLVLEKKRYNTLTRLSYSLEKQYGQPVTSLKHIKTSKSRKILKYTTYFVVFILSLLSYFDWQHTAIVYDTHNPLMRIQGDSLVLALRDDPSKWRPFALSFDARTNFDYEEILKEASKYARG